MLEGAACSFGGKPKIFASSFNRLPQKTVGQQNCKYKIARLAVLHHSGDRTFVRMTRARTASYGLVTPPPLHRWMHAVLMLFAELVSHAVSTLQMVLVRRTRECHTQAAPEVLPRATSGLHQETDQAAPTGLSTGSGLQPAFPAQAGIQTPLTVRTRKLSLRSSRRTSGSRADGEPCPTLQLQSPTRVETVPGFRRLILSRSKDARMSGRGCIKSA